MSKELRQTTGVWISAVAKDIYFQDIFQRLKWLTLVRD